MPCFVFWKDLKNFIKILEERVYIKFIIALTLTQFETFLPSYCISIMLVKWSYAHSEKPAYLSE